MKKQSKLQYPIVLALSCILASSAFTDPQIPWVAPEAVNKVENALPHSAEVVSLGKKLYESTCWTCHGLDGKGDGPAAATLQVKPADHTSLKIQSESDGAIFWKISTGRGDMQAYNKLFTVRERWALVH
ncbi:MAG: cytochrome c, partial [Bacteroidia bacterium]|nr:cytochrome c [Bacteroidia bacterium]